MGMEKRNIVEPRRTPATEEKRADADWDVQAATAFVSQGEARATEAKDGASPERT